MTARTTHEIRILTNPYPVPKSETVFLQKPNGPVGIRFSSDSENGPVEVHEITNASPLKKTAVTVGKTCMAINGIPIKTPTQAAALIKEIPISGTLAITVSDKTPNFCRVVSAPFSQKNPGINFDSARGRTLVRVSKVFSKGSFSKQSIRKGDVVLAVNGVPVSKVEDADRLLKQPADDVSIYILDMDGVVRKIAKELARVHPKFGPVSIVRVDDGEYDLRIDSVAKRRLFIDADTLRLSDPDSYEKLRVDATPTSLQFARLFWKGSYGELVRPFVKAVNAFIDQQIGALEDEVCQRAWQYALSPAAAQGAGESFPSVEVVNTLNWC